VKNGSAAGSSVLLRLRRNRSGVSRAGAGGRTLFAPRPARCDDRSRMLKLPLTVSALVLHLLLLTGCPSPQGSPHKTAGGAGQGVPKKSWEEVSAEASRGSALYDEAQQVGTITAPELSEISGLAPGRAARGVWWAHNDSGGKARIYAVSQTGQLLASFDVAGATNVDWEDIAAAPGADSRPALYIADTGNNGRDRDELTIYRVREPQFTPGARAGAEGVISGATEAAEAFHFRYPDGRHDAEAIFVDPRSLRVYVVTKTMRENCRVYRFPHPPRAGERVTLEAVTGARVEAVERMRLVTGAATSPDGSRVVVRTYFSAFEFQRAPGGRFESVFDRDPTSLKLPQTRQGEAIAYSADGQSLVTTSEKLPAPLYQMTRK
jgi:hypothetical protein